MILYFLLRGLDCKWTGWKKWVSFSLSVIILFTLITFENKYRIFEGFDSIPLILFLLLYSFFCLQEHIFTKALMVFVVMSMVHSTNTVVVAVYSFISHVPVQELASEYTIHRVFAIILTKMVCRVCLYRRPASVLLRTFRKDIVLYILILLLLLLFVNSFS